MDRLALCVHRPSSQRDEVRSAIAALGDAFVRPTIAMVAAPLIAGGHVTVQDLVLLDRYGDPDAVRISFGAHVAAGLLDAHGRPSPLFAALAQRIVDVQAESAAEIWSGYESLVNRLCELTAGAIASAAKRASYPLAAFDQQRRPPEPPSPAGCLLRRITVLRYLRSDVHAAHPLEQETNEQMAALLGALTDGERAELLEGCQRLPGTDPREDAPPPAKAY